MFRRFSFSLISSSPSTSSSSNLYIPKFRCPVCHGGTLVTTTTTISSNRQKKTSSKKNNNYLYNNKNNCSWMTGEELDHHLFFNGLSHWTPRRHKLLHKIENYNHDGDKNSKTTNRSHHNLTREKFESELKMTLLSLPNSSLVDRYVILDSSNIQMRGTQQTGVIGLSATGGEFNTNKSNFIFNNNNKNKNKSNKISTICARDIDHLWKAFQTQRICVIFIQEHFLKYSTNDAPIFSILGALAEGSANLHDFSSSFSSWRRRNYKFRLLGGIHDLDSEEEQEKMKNDLLRINTNTNQDDDERENPTRPWNSILVPTVRGPEAGDFALFETALELNRILKVDEERFGDYLLNQNKEQVKEELFVDPDLKYERRAKVVEEFRNTSPKKRQHLLQPSRLSRIDVISGDKELAEALDATILGDGRFTQHYSLEDFASCVLRGD